MSKKLFVLYMLSALSSATSYSSERNNRKINNKSKSSLSHLSICDRECYLTYEGLFGFKGRQQQIINCVASCIKFHTMLASSKLNKK